MFISVLKLNFDSNFSKLSDTFSIYSRGKNDQMKNYINLNVVVTDFCSYLLVLFNLTGDCMTWLMILMFIMFPAEVIVDRAQIARWKNILLQHRVQTVHLGET